MHAPHKRPTPPAPRRAPLASTGSVGLSAALVREQLHRPLTAQELAHEQAQAAQHRRYQQITRSAKSFTRQQSVARQDGPIAYYAQARMHAELKYKAQTSHRLSLEKAAQQQYAANQTYIRQGPNRTMKEEAEHQRQLAMKRNYDKYVEGVRATNSSEIANTVLHDVVLRSVAESSLVAMGPNLSIARLAGTARWLGAARMATAMEGVSTRLGYQTISSSEVLTWHGAKQAAGIFGRRAVVDAGLQYTGALIVNTGKPQLKEGILWASVSDISVSSMLMAGLPGDTWIHSVRNAAVSNAFEWKLNNKALMTFKTVDMSTNIDALNYAQKIVFSVGADYLAGRYSGRVQQAHDGTRLLRPIGSRYDPLVMAEWRQTRSLLQTMQVGQYPIKVTGGVLSAHLESYFLPPNATEIK